MKWMSVDEKLPIKEKDVLVYAENENDLDYGFAHFCDRKEGWRLFCGLPYDRKVTHWMSLPSAPKKEKK